MLILIMRLARNRAVVMVTGDRVERPPARGEPPEAAAGGLRSDEVRYPAGWRLLELGGNTAPLEAESLGKWLLYAAIIRHLLSPFG